MKEIDSTGTEALLWLVWIGFLTGLGTLLASDEKLSIRLVVGRGIVSGMLATAAAIALVFIPDLPFVAMVGIAATIASMGTTLLEDLIRTYLNLVPRKNRRKTDCEPKE